MGIPITIHYTLWFVFFLIAWSLASGYMPKEYPGLGTTTYWGIGITSAILLFASVLIHELSHSYVAKKNGLRIRRITLFFFGGVSEITEEPHDARLEVRMAAAGPLMSFLIAAILGAVWLMGKYFRAPIPLTATLQYGAYINALLGLFNLLPAFPVDGGRVLRGSLWKRSGNLLHATRTAGRISEILSWIMIAAGLGEVFFGNFVDGIWIIFLGWFIKSGADMSMKQTILAETLSGVSVESMMTRDVLTVQPDITVQQLVSGYFLTHKHGGYPVIKDGKILGIVTLQCARSIPKERWATTSINDAMIPCERTITIKPTASASEALNIMTREDVGRILVVKDGRLLGILTRGDLMRTIHTKQELGLS
jgi:Zn-dependent protease/predicted transcriptional regulator